MATMNKSSSSSSSSLIVEWTYDVFISFRGEDTRKCFIGYLFQRLCEIPEIKTFIDDRRIAPGERIDETLMKAIQESRIGLVVFSTNYASSSFCLEELAKIIECSIGQQGMLFLPIFYEVEPSVPRKQTGSYKEALAKHSTRFEEEKIHKWKKALEKAAGVSGFSSKNYMYDSDLVDDIAQFIIKSIRKLRDHDINQTRNKMDDEYIDKVEKYVTYSSFGAIFRKRREKTKELSPHDAAVIIQRKFRACLTCRSRFLRALRDMAEIKSHVNKIRAQFNNFSYRRRVLRDREELQYFSEKIVTMLIILDYIEGGDLTVRSTKKSIVDELEAMLDGIDPKFGQSHTDIIRGGKLTRERRGITKFK